MIYPIQKTISNEEASVLHTIQLFSYLSDFVMHSQKNEYNMKNILHN